MDEHDLLMTELPHMSDRTASDLLDLLEALFASIDSHYYARVARYRRRLRDRQTDPQPEPFPNTKPPF